VVSILLESGENVPAIVCKFGQTINA